MDEDVQKRWFELCKKLNFRELGSPRLYTLADDIEVGELLMVDKDSKCSSMKFIDCYLHDGLAGKSLHYVHLYTCCTCAAWSGHMPCSCLGTTCRTLLLRHAAMDWDSLLR